MRGVLLACALGLAVVTAGCGSGSPTQAQMQAQLQWSAKNDALLMAAEGPPGHPFVDQDPTTLTPAQCRQFATASREGLATSPMPVESLEALWKSYLQDLAAVSAACVSGLHSNEGNEQRQARGTLDQLIQIADKLAAEFHQLPKG